MGAGLNSIIFDDLEWPITRVSRLRCILGTKISVVGSTTLIGNHTRSTKWCHFQWPSVTADPDFKVTTFLAIEYLRYDTRWSHSYYRTSIGSHMRSIAWWHFQWPWWTPNPVFKSRWFWSRISQKQCVLGTMLLKNTNRKPYTYLSNDATFNDLEWPLTPISRSRHFLKLNIVKTAPLKDKLLLHKRKLYLTYGMVLCLVTWLTTKCIACVCQHQLSFLLLFEQKRFTTLDFLLTLVHIDN